MQDLQQGLGTLVALVNTSPQVAGAEELGDLDTLRAFVVARTITEIHEPALSDLPELHKLRGRLRAVVTATGDERLALVNRALAGATIEPRLVTHDDLGTHIHYFAPYVSIAEHLGADCLMCVALLIASGESARLRTCGAPDCSRALLDTSRNRSRAYCDSQKCGNRLAAAAYRSRRRAPADR
ncbi:CGNR zinc finger domain-containing protein [Asanoa sp. NPDC050611]|uniref:CGNR zinc finger domain-containing protein n=1 Tax=Asanoa sp. NPDC050611 TaxID=3157098 RepID=UPI0033CE40FE